MTTEFFNALPEAARRFIQSQQTCLSCGKKNNLDAHYKNYLVMKNQSLFTLRNGAISFVDTKTKKSQILYPLHPKDTDAEIKEKLKIALRINAVRPQSFLTISIEEIEIELKGKKATTKKEVIKDESPAIEAETPAEIEEAPALENEDLLG